MQIYGHRLTLTSIWTYQKRFDYSGPGTNHSRCFGRRRETYKTWGVETCTAAKKMTSLGSKSWMAYFHGRERASERVESQSQRLHVYPGWTAHNEKGQN